MNNNPVREFVLNHAWFFLLLAVILFITLCFKICGICAVDSGGMRNFMVNGV